MEDHIILTHDGLVRFGKKIIAERNKNKGDLSQEFLDGFAEGVAECIAALLHEAAADILEEITK